MKCSKNHKTKVENCPLSEIEPTALSWLWLLTLTFSPRRDGCDPFTCKRSRSKVNLFER